MAYGLNGTLTETYCSPPFEFSNFCVRFALVCLRHNNPPGGETNKRSSDPIEMRDFITGIFDTFEERCSSSATAHACTARSDVLHLTADEIIFYR